MSQNSLSRLRRNNFDLLRLVFSITVCLVHAQQLSGFRELSWIAKLFSSAVAVKGFFVISGFLIFMSYERTGSIAAYAAKRFRRIYPAYFTVVMVGAIALVAVSSKPPSEYFSAVWLKYLAANLSFLNFLQLTLPGVFEVNKLTAVNGALWTLKIEVLFYLSVPIFVLLFRRLGLLPVLLVTYCGSVLYVSLCNTLAQRTGSGIYRELANQLPGQLSYFMAGAAWYYYRHWFELRAKYLTAAAGVILILNHVFLVPWLEPFALGTIVIFLALFAYMGNVGKYGDFSYGVYILHFPIVQLLLSSGWFQGKPEYFLAATLLVTALGAVTLWHLVEKRFLPRSSHYLEATAPAS